MSQSPYKGFNSSGKGIVEWDAVEVSQSPYKGFNSMDL